MHLKLTRFSDNSNATLGLLYIDDEFFCFTLEDEFREDKISDETRIPEGVYPLGIQEKETELTLSYRKKYSFFQNHIHIKDVPGFTGIYVHIGNYEYNISGCILVSKTAIAGNGLDGYKLGYGSQKTYQELYQMIYKRLENEVCTIEIMDAENRAINSFPEIL